MGRSDTPSSHGCESSWKIIPACLRSKWCQFSGARGTESHLGPEEKGTGPGVALYRVGCSIDAGTVEEIYFFRRQASLHGREGSFRLLPAADLRGGNVVFPAPGGSRLGNLGPPLR